MIFGNAVGRTLRNAVQLICYRLTSGLQPHPELNVQSADSKRVPFGVAIAAGDLFCAGNPDWWGGFTKAKRIMLAVLLAHVLATAIARVVLPRVPPSAR